ncbi:MAG: ATP-binding cassette domain-containing protein [Bacteroidales bacterium]|nr:ATP-binding cassette domain-containing protein [Bacteroidales bacterium]
MATAIEFNHVSKLYRLGLVSTGTFREDIKRWWTTQVRHKEDPFLTIGETNDRGTKGESQFVWALRDIDFKVEQGDVVGIIGKNGAGKSTLLKLLSKITAPTTGDIRARGRIASLLEVGTGFHPEMTGRENIYLNGAILGMTKEEISRKLDEIIDFSGCERYIDTPVKRYSSGMRVRLGFAVAAHLDPDILVVDEVLAVGDAEFQKKAIGKMQDVSTSQGRTVLFVSHNMASVRALCKNGVLLENGIVRQTGTADEIIDLYLKTSADSELRDHLSTTEIQRNKNTLRELEYTEVRILNDVRNVSTEEPLIFNLKFHRNNRSINNCQIGIIIRDEFDNHVGSYYSQQLALPSDTNDFEAKVVLKNHQLAMGIYRINFNLSLMDFVAKCKNYDIVIDAIQFEIKYLDKCHHIPFAHWPFSGRTSYQDAEIEIYPLKS